MDTTTTPAGYVTLTVPATFWYDHDDRDLVTFPHTCQPKGKRVVITLHPLDAHELYDDARHYASWTGPDRAENRGICASAAATVNAIDKAADAATIARWAATVATPDEVAAADAARDTAADAFYEATRTLYLARHPGEVLP